MKFIALTIFGFVAMEAFSYAVHRFLFHGALWRIHRTHHEPRRFFLELNDIFSLIFAFASIGLMTFANQPLLNSISFPIGLGIAIYGLVYFIAHDFFTHRRLPFKSGNKILLAVRAAHQRHHQTTEQSGIEPFGFLAFRYAEFSGKTIAKKHEATRE